MIGNFFRILADIITRNPLTTLFLVMLMVAAPSLFGVLALILLVPIFALVIGVVTMMWRVRKVQQQMEEQMRQQGYQQGFRQGRADANFRRGRAANRREGDVTLTATPTEQRINDDVGEYVTFTEEKDSER